MNKIIDEIKKRKHINEQLTPKFAHYLISIMPNESIYEISYDPLYKKFFKDGENGELLAWSQHLKKWILWIHDISDVQWKYRDIHDKRREYKYLIGDKVVYCGLSNSDTSYVYIVEDYFENKYVLTDGKDYHEAFYMDNWRLATKDEIELNERIFISCVMK